MPTFTRGARAQVLKDYKEHIQNAGVHFMKAYTENKCEKIDILEYEPLSYVAGGSFGEVFKVRKEGPRGGIYAVKKQEKTDDIQGLTEIIQEKRIHWGLKNLFVVELFASWKTRDHVFLIMDYAPIGDVTKLPRYPLPETQAVKVFSQIVLGLEYIHACNVIHRDLKEENILVFDKGLCKLADFGQACISTTRPNEPIGTTEYMAPEMHTGAVYTEAVDWWALGITMYRMLLKRHPFFDETKDVDRQTIIDAVCGETEIANKMSPKISNPVRAMIIKLLDRNPEERLGVLGEGVAAVKKHPFFSDIDFASLIYEEDFPEIRLPDIRVDSLRGYENAFKNLGKDEDDDEERRALWHDF